MLITYLLKNFIYDDIIRYDMLDKTKCCRDNNRDAMINYYERRNDLNKRDCKKRDQSINSQLKNSFYLIDIRIRN